MDKSKFDKIKVIIFDFDETMYTSSTIKEYYVKYIKQTLTDLTSLSEKEILTLMEKYGFMSSGKERISFGKNCDKFGVTKEQWNKYRIDNFFQIDYKNAVTSSNEVYEKLSKLKKLFIVSNEVKENLVYKAKMMNIDLKPFTIYAPLKKDVLTYKSNKEDCYKKIIEECQVSPDEVLVVGDRYNVDILPLENLGGHGILINNAKQIEDIFKENVLWKICN